MTQLYQTVALYTTSKLNDPSPQPFNYYLDYTYSQLLDVAIQNLKLLKGQVDYVILFRSNSTQKWMLPTDTLRSLGAQNGNMIHVLPSEVQSRPQNNTKKAYEFENQSGDQATLHGKNGETYRFKEKKNDEEEEAVEFGKAVDDKTPQPTAKSQIDILLSSERSPERQAEIHKMGAERGLPDEQQQWAQCLMNGYGTKKDMKEAAKWMKIAASHGNPKANFNYGMMLLNGDGVDQDPESSLEYFKNAADKGHPTAQYTYGALLMKGEVCERDPEQGLAYIQAAEEQGEPQAVEYMSHFKGY